MTTTIKGGALTIDFNKYDMPAEGVITIKGLFKSLSNAKGKTIHLINFHSDETPIFKSDITPTCVYYDVDAILIYFTSIYDEYSTIFTGYLTIDDNDNVTLTEIE